jgi:hypothetical protein
MPKRVARAARWSDRRPDNGHAIDVAGLQSRIARLLTASQAIDNVVRLDGRMCGPPTPTVQYLSVSAPIAPPAAGRFVRHNGLTIAYSATRAANRAQLRAALTPGTKSSGICGAD